MQIFLEHLPIQHEGDGRVAVLHFQLQVSEGSGLFLRAQCRRETAIRLHHGVGNIPWIKDVFATQCFQQVGSRQPEGAQSVLVDLSVQDDRLGAARHQVEKFLAAEAQRRPQQLQSRDEEEGNEAGRHRYFFRLDGDGRQI